jgi:RNA polymerase sigma factor (sigma-70 family)
VTKTREVVGAVWRMESARIVGALARYTGDLALAEDVAQEALAEALVSWSRDGVPNDPAAWLMTVGRRRAIDVYRRKFALDKRYAAFAHELDEGGLASGGEGESQKHDVLFDPDHIDDDFLALIFTSCHPVLSAEQQIALTLRVVGGLTSDEIARAFLIPTATAQARITRAKKALSSAGVPFETPAGDERRARLAAVLSVVYLMFTEGSTATSGDDLMRPDLAHEAVRLARILSRLVPDESDTHGLLALLELTAARFPARIGADGEPVLLEHQNRDRWDLSAVRRGRAALTEAHRNGRGLGVYGIQASIAECHAMAKSVEETDWDQIVVLYEALAQLAPSPVVELNRAVAIAMASGPDAALPLVDALATDKLFAESHLLPSVRGELLMRLGRTEDARAELETAISRCDNTRERAVLERKLASL